MLHGGHNTREKRHKAGVLCFSKKLTLLFPKKPYFLLTRSSFIDIINGISGCGEVWYRAWFGSKRPGVRIPTLRPKLWEPLMRFPQFFICGGILPRPGGARTDTSFDTMRIKTGVRFFVQMPYLQGDLLTFRKNHWRHPWLASLRFSFNASIFCAICRMVSRNTSSLFPVGSSNPQSSRCEQGRNGHWTLQPMVITTSTGGSQKAACCAAPQLPCRCDTAFSSDVSRQD